MATSPNDADELAARVQDLPPELFDDIYQRVFSISKSKSMTVNITSDYKLPSILQVDRHSREKLAEGYYTWNTFTFDGTRASTVRMCRWISRLSESHRNCIRYIWRKDCRFAKLHSRKELLRYWLSSFEEMVSTGRDLGEKVAPFIGRRLCVEAVIRKENNEVFVHTGWGSHSKARFHEPKQA